MDGGARGLYSIAPCHEKPSFCPRAKGRARGGSPWIFSNEIRMDEAAKAIAPGAVVNVRGEDGRAFGTGYFNPKSLIAVRLLVG